MFIVSLLGVYFSCIMATVASSVVTTIMILSFHHRQNNSPHLNYHVIIFSLSIMLQLLMSLCCKCGGTL
jgi:hypothetical protein